MENRKYYFLKLKENFFDEDSIVILESMKDGMVYINLLMKMYLKSLKNNGKLQFDENIPYTAEMIAKITRHSLKTVERAMPIFQNLGLVEVMSNGGYYMSNIELLTGKSSTEGERKRRARMEIHSPSVSLPKEQEANENPAVSEADSTGLPGCPHPDGLGKFHNVILSDQEFSKLKEEIPDQLGFYIDRLSTYISSTGKEYKSHAATILKWAQEDRRKAGSRGIPDYSFKEGESL